MDDRVDGVLDGLAGRGFAKMAGVLDAAAVARLRAAAARLAAREAEDWSGATEWFTARRWRPVHFAGAGRNENLFDCLGLDAELDAAVEALLEQQDVDTLLERALGADRRLWFAQLRWAVPGADEYVLHQDLYGELGLCVLLDDHADADGSLVLWPGSQRWPRVLDALPPLRPSLVRPRLSAVEGAPGDACVFLNKTWHGRTVASGKPRLVLLLSFLPPGPLECGRRLPETTRARLGPVLRRLTDPRAGRPFAAPPRAPPFTTTFEADGPGADAGRGDARDAEEAFVAFAWAAAGGSLGEYGRVVRDAARFAVVPRGALDALSADFRRRAEADGVGAPAVAAIDAAHALECGDVHSDAGAGPDEEPGALAPERLDAVGRHLVHLALRAEFEPGLRALRDHLPKADDPRRAGELWTFWRGASLLFTRWRRAAPDATVPDPRSEAADRVALAELDRDFAQRLSDLAARFDRRNGNDARARLVEQWRGRAEDDSRTVPGL